MNILLVDCYPAGWQDRLAAYRRLLEPFGRLRTIRPEELPSADGAEGTPTLPLPLKGEGMKGRGLPGLTAAVVLSGSPTMLTEEPPPAGLIESLRELTIPVFGICFGHQVLGLATGVRVGQREFYEAPALVRVRRPEPLFTGMEDRLVVLQSHAEFLEPETLAAAGWEVLADSRLCPVEAMRHRERPWYGVQFHPERSGLVGRAVMENFFSRVVEPA